MADTKVVGKLDKKLMDSSVIDPNFAADYKKVHTMLNTHVRKSGKILTEETFLKGDEALRKWLMTLYKKGASQEKLTSYLRCGLAHLSFDFIESTYESISIDDLIARALRSFKLRNFHKSFFKVALTKVDKDKQKKKAVKKKPASKKAVKKKAPKKAAKKTVKKTAKKKAVAKKTSSKKSTKKAVKTTAKKSTKKKTASKTAPKKKSTQKKAKPKGKAKKKKNKDNVSAFLEKLLG